MAKILFVEDEKPISELLRRKFEELGHTVLVANDGEKGLQIATSEMPDIVLLDIILPKKTGVEVLQSLRQNEKTKNISVFMLSNLDFAAHAAELNKEQIEGYLLKTDWSIKDIVEKVQTLLTKKDIK